MRTRLTSPANVISFDLRYICHCYDIMKNVSASRNDTRLFIKRCLTFSEDKHGNLGIIGSRDSYILGSVDSKHMVKNLCTSQKYIYWSYFFNFDRKSKQTFWNKGYSIMVGKSLERYLSRI